MHDWKMELYWRLPVPVQELGLSLYGWRLERLYHGPEFKSFCRFLEEADSWSAEQMAQWQGERLRELVRTAASHVPYYRRAWKDSETLEVRSARDLPRLPLLDRQNVRSREREFLDERLEPGGMFPEKTSGTTGTSITVYWPKEALQRRWAVYEMRALRVAGVSRDIPRAMMGGRSIVPGRTLDPPFWRRNWYWRQLYMSSYHVSRRNAPAYVEAIRASGVRWLTGYGSAIAALAESAMSAGTPPLRLRCVLVSGDTLQPGMRSAIERFFQCRCYDMWGQAEGVGMAMECAHGRLHIIPEIGILEIVRPDGTACLPGEIGEIAATGLLNQAMPLVRYRTGDYAAWSRDTGCACGGKRAILESLEGRVDDYLVTEDGRQIGRLSTAMKRSPTIHSAQIVQDRPGHAYLLVRPGEGYRPEDATPVVDDVLERIGSFSFEVVETAEIPKTPTGKTKLVVRLAELPQMRETYRVLVEQAGLRFQSGEEDVA